MRTEVVQVLVMGGRDPRGPEEWQEAVDLANLWLHVDAAVQYGLLERGPEIDVDRCEEILRRARRHGMVYPRPVEVVLAEIRAEQGVTA